MSYEKQTWSTGDTITAAKLNNIEQGIASILVTEVVPNGDDGAVLTNTWQEIHDATLCVVKMYGGAGFAFFLPNVHSTEGEYTVSATINDSPVDFVTDSADGYPAISMG